MEAKLSAGPIARHHFVHAEALGGIPFVQVVREEPVAEQRQAKVWQISASRFLAGFYAHILPAPGRPGKALLSGSAFVQIIFQCFSREAGHFV